MKKTILILLLIVVAIQFIPRGLPQVKTDNPGDLIKTAQVPGNIAKILKTSCYDCHSNETKYLWYSYIVPVNFLIKRDVEEGREHLNFSEWAGLKKSKKAKALDEISEEVDEDEMPMGIYTLIHLDAKLSEKDKKALIDWTENYAESLFSK